MLSLKDRNCFFGMWLGLLAFVNDKYKVIRAFGHPRTAKETKGEDAFAIRNKLWECPDVIDEYIASVDMSRERVHTLENWKTTEYPGNFYCRGSCKNTPCFWIRNSTNCMGFWALRIPMRQDFHEEYMTLKKRDGIITRLGK